MGFQTKVKTGLRAGIGGELAIDDPHTGGSKTLESGTVKMGRVVTQSSTADHLCKAGGTGVFLGIAGLPKSQSNPTNFENEYQYKAGDLVDFYSSGTISVVVESAVDIKDDSLIVVYDSTTGQVEQAATASTTKIEIKNAKFINKSVASDQVATLKIANQ